MDNFEASSITSEKNLWAVWKQTRLIPRSRFNRLSLLVTAVALLLYVCSSKQSPADMAEMVREWADIGLDFAGTILGFLIAGFTIFATLSRPGLLAAMARVIDDESGLSYLKRNAFVFFEAFGWYIGFAGLCVLVLVFGSKDGAVTQIGLRLPEEWQPPAAEFVSRSIAFLMGAWFVLLCLELKSFVYNIYHVAMTSVRWTVEYSAEEGSVCRFDPPIKPSVSDSSIKPRS